MRKLIHLTLLTGLCAGVWAADAPSYNVISLQAEARREVVNDLAQATLYVEYSDANPAVLADKLNRAAADALKLAKSYPAIKAATGGNNVYPLYSSKNKADGWRGRADIRLESVDFKAMAELIGKLQSNMQLGGVSFAVAPATRERVETELIDEAAKAFRNRAEVVKKSFGGKTYKLVNISINTSGGYAPPPRMYAAKALMAADVAAPPMEGGDSQIVVGVSGSIQLD